MCDKRLIVLWEPSYRGNYRTTDYNIYTYIFVCMYNVFVIVRLGCRNDVTETSIIELIMVFEVSGCVYNGWCVYVYVCCSRRGEVEKKLRTVKGTTTREDKKKQIYHSYCITAS